MNETERRLMVAAEQCNIPAYKELFAEAAKEIRLHIDASEALEERAHKRLHESEPPHCPTCDCGSTPSGEANAVHQKGHDERAEFRNFHRVLCERFGYGHDEIDWKRDQLSLIEHIASLVPPKGVGWCMSSRLGHRSRHALNAECIDWLESPAQSSLRKGDV